VLWVNILYKETNMYRAYVLFNVKTGMLEKATQTLESKTGVAMVDILEDQPAIMMVIQARSRQKLAGLTVKAIVSVESLTEGMLLMPARDISHPRNKKTPVATFVN
jgi:hypothetical protein